MDTKSADALYLRGIRFVVEVVDGKRLTIKLPNDDQHSRNQHLPLPVMLLPASSLTDPSSLSNLASFDANEYLCVRFLLVLCKLYTRTLKNRRRRDAYVPFEIRPRFSTN